MENGINGMEIVLSVALALVEVCCFGTVSGAGKTGLIETDSSGQDQKGTHGSMTSQ